MAPAEALSLGSCTATRSTFLGEEYVDRHLPRVQKAVAYYGTRRCRKLLLSTTRLRIRGQPLSFCASVA
jgi:hypothetical protein